MELRQLGTSGLSTTRLVLGGNGFGGRLKDSEAFAVLDRFIAAGGTMVRTADDAVGGESETLIGEWLRRRGRRDDVLIATSVGSKDIWNGKIAGAAEASLRRLGTDHIDLYLADGDFIDLDAPVPEPLDYMVRDLDRLVRDGKVRAIGAHDFSAKRIAEALAVSEQEGLAGFSVLQEKYNLMDQAFEGPLQRLVLERNLGFLGCAGLAWGFLTGKYRSPEDRGKSPRGNAMVLYAGERGDRTLAALDEVTDETGATTAQVALAWVSAQPGVTAPIAGVTSVEQLEELIGAMTLELDANQIDRLTAAASRALA